MGLAHRIDADWVYFPANKMMGWLFFCCTQRERAGQESAQRIDEYSMGHEYEAQNVPGIRRGFGCDRRHISFIYISADGIQS
jgi:hypothetical protein